MTVREHGNRWTAFALFIGLAILLFFASRDFLAMRKDPPIYPGPGVSRVVKLSTYCPTIAGTDDDTEVYFLEGDKKGGTALLVGGTHPNEPAGTLAAVTVIENAVVKCGRVIVIPRADHSAFTHTPPLEAYPETYSIKTPRGERVFRCGSRHANPVDQWPDPLVYVNAFGQTLAGEEARNLNRCYPGRRDGYLTERLAYAIVNLIKKEKVDIAIDLHESSPEYPVTDTIVAHDRAMEIAAEAAMNLEFEGMEISVEPSPKELHGFSHREWGDYTQAVALLLEVANPAQGRLRGRTDSSLILSGKDPYYVRAAKEGLLYVPFTSKGHPLKERVGRHLEAFSMLLKVFSGHYPAKAVTVTNLPGLKEVMKNGLGAYLAPPPS